MNAGRKVTWWAKSAHGDLVSMPGIVGKDGEAERIAKAALGEWRFLRGRDTIEVTCSFDPVGEPLPEGRVFRVADLRRSGPSFR